MKMLQRQSLGTVRRPELGRLDSVEQSSYEKNLVEGDIKQAQGSHVVDFAEDLVTEERGSYERGLVDGDITQTEES